MNRTGSFLAAALIGGSFVFGQAGAQVPLVVGSVRDRHGAAIGGAEVTGLNRSGGPVAETSTDTAGTFALPGDGVVAVAVACRYCAHRTLAVSAGTPVVAIVQRYDALLDDAPNTGDLANLPYAHVESAVALRPFTLLRQTTAIFPGSQLSDRGLLPANALVVDDGVPNYDFSFGSSPYGTIPASFERSASVSPPSDAFLYGDRAGSGIVSLDPFGGEAADVATAGGDTIVRLAAGTDGNGVVAGSSSNDDELRQRADARLTVPLSTAQTFFAGAGSSQDRQYGDATSSLDGNFTFANAVFDDAEPSVDVHAAFAADRGGYWATDGGRPISDVWSDAQYDAGVRTPGAIAAFADVSSRLSTGIYDAAAYLEPRIAGTLQQNRLDAGIEASGSEYDLTAGVGAYGLGFTGGWGGGSTPSSAHLATPSVRLRLFPRSHWSADLQAGGSFTLPTLWQQYALAENPSVLTYDRNALYAATLTYSDDARVRVSVEAASQRVHGYTDGLVTSSGASIAWQIAPQFSVRAWTMYATDTTAPPPGSPYFPVGTPSNVDAFWLTYENGDAIRIDAIYRRDLLDGGPFEHFDGDVSGPITGRLRWYAGVEDRYRTTYFDAGLRLSR
ncbi:MAG TPA: carboxypeptidase-like regulatory domain-containing protein [Candidatus Tumulicola sp.]|nr:carboxypeptidase-like regulatory domain-containing protein [Candidatus Tumulicola sp.]